MGNMDFRYYDTVLKQWVSSLVDIDDYNIVKAQSALNTNKITNMLNRLGVVAKQITDWDSITETGFYTAVDALNSPEDLGAGIWIIGFAIVNDANHIFVKVNGLFSGDKSYTRRKMGVTNSKWAKWVDEADGIYVAPTGATETKTTLNSALKAISGIQLYAPTKVLQDVYVYKFDNIDFTKNLGKLGTWNIDYQVSPFTNQSNEYIVSFGLRAFVNLAYSAEVGTHYKIDLETVYDFKGWMGANLFRSMQFVNSDMTVFKPTLTYPEMTAGGWGVALLVNGFPTDTTPSFHRARCTKVVVL